MRTLEKLLINCETNRDQNCSKICVILASNLDNHGETFSITDAKLYVSVVTLPTR